jgi:acyl carrier protein
MTTREQITEDVLGLLQTLAGDWDYGDEITLDTKFFSDMDLASLDLVMLGTAVQEHYGRRFPFVQFFAELGQRGGADIPVREWVDFIHSHLEAEDRGTDATPSSGLGG